MIRAYVWFRCAAMHDPVLPMSAKPAVIGWRGKNRHIDLTIEREFTGAELLRRMKGWITVDSREAVELLERFGRLKCFDEGELVIEVEDSQQLELLERELAARFHDQCNLEVITKKRPLPSQ